MRDEGVNIPAANGIFMPHFFANHFPVKKRRHGLLGGAWLAGLSVVLAATRSGFSAQFAAEPDDTTVTSSNWSGYADLASSGQTFSNVSGEWVIPKITSSSGSYSAIWVGLDGFNSDTVEQTGIGSYASGGATVYYAWYEMYPKDETEITSLTVAPGNLIYADASYIGYTTSRRGSKEYEFDLTLDDLTTGKDFSTTQETTTDDARSSSEWIAESPADSSGILPLANFGSVSFTDASTTLDGTTGTISSFNNDAIELENSNGLDGVPSYLNSAGNSFTITVTPQPSPIYWAGSGSGDIGDGTTWDVGFNQNWINGNIQTTYLNGDDVIFNDSGAPNYNVTLNTTVTPGSVTVNNSAGNYVISGTGSIAGTTALTKQGTAALTLSTANTYTGTTTISAGILQIGNGSSGSISNSSAVTVSSGANLEFDEANGATQSNAISDSGAVTGLQGGGITNTLAGAITGAGGFTQSGAGATVLSGMNTYTGATTISVGTLALGASGSISDSTTINVANGATFNVSAVNGGFTLGDAAAQTLEGSGNVTGNVIVASQGAVSPGIASSNTIGTLTLSANAALGGTFSAQVTPTSGSNDELSVGGNATLGGAENITTTGALTSGESFKVIQGNVYGNFATVNLASPGGGLSWNQPLNINTSITGATNTYQTNYTYSVTNSTPSYISETGNQYTGLTARENGGRNTTVTFLGGSVSTPTSLSVQFQSAPGNNPQLLSDVAAINGTNSDAYVLQMSYSILPTNEALSSVLAAYNPSTSTADGQSLITNTFVSAVLLNTGGTPVEFNGAYAGQDVVGDYGINTSNDTVWAVLNYSDDDFVVLERADGDWLGTGAVNAADLDDVVLSLGASTEDPDGNPVWSEFAFDGGDIVDAADLDDTARGLGAQEAAGEAADVGGGLTFSSPSDVPEPGSLGLLVFGAIGLTLRRRKKKA